MRMSATVSNITAVKTVSRTIERARMANIGANLTGGVTGKLMCYVMTLRSHLPQPVQQVQPAQLLPAQRIEQLVQ